MSLPTMAVDYETRVDFDRLRAERLARARKQLGKHELGAVLCFDFNNIRYITSSHICETLRDKMARYCVLPDGGDPVLFDLGNIVEMRKERCPWLKGRVRPSRGTMVGAVPTQVGVPKVFAREIKEVLEESGVGKGPVGIDLFDYPLYEALSALGVEVRDGQQAMHDARMVKTKEEIELLKLSAALVSAAYHEIVEAIKPGIRESDLVAIANHTLFTLGSDDVECINVISGPRTNPHPHDFSDRIIRPGDLVFIDILQAYMGYRSCYYRTFICGEPTRKQKDLYRQAYEWLYASIEAVKPGATTADIARCWPEAGVWGYRTEAEAVPLAFGHGLGLSIWEKPIITRLFSLDHPFPIVEGMVFALETYAGQKGDIDGARIEEEVVVTAEGCEVITKYPCQELISCGSP